MMFQSLIRFKINWNIDVRLNNSTTIMFQSLIGFKINWNNINVIRILRMPAVSIPNRV